MPFVKYLNKSPTTYDNGAQSGQPVPGMIQRGNIDVNHRPSITNADGSRSSIFSMTVPLDKNASPISWDDPNPASYALVPSIAHGRFLMSDGKMPTDDAGIKRLEKAATDYYGKTRQQLGVFNSPSSADEYATLNHDYGNNGTGTKVYTPSPTLKARADYIQKNQNAPEPQTPIDVSGMDLMTMRKPLKEKND